jgi:predicted metalloprotease
MRLRGARESENVERDTSGLGRSPRRGGAQIGGLGLVIVLLLGLFFGVDVTPLLQGDGGGGPVAEGPARVADPQAESDVAKVLAFTEDAWAAAFKAQVGEPYVPATLRFYYGSGKASACGQVSAAMGPFYCPGDRIVYIDTDFFTTLERELGAQGDFAAAYVVAHEVAHHVQNQLGILGEVNALRQRSPQEVSNALSVRVELQADCFSGIWARSMEERFGVLDAGDIEEAVNAARQIGDDVLMRRAGQTPQPHMFTHGSAAQRARWFATGYQTGQIDACNTFRTDRL